MKLSLIAIYVVHFADGRIKFGLTGDIEKRMRTYKHEAVRNNVANMVWWACEPLKCRADARVIENDLCRALRSFAISGHREWLRGVTFKSVVEYVEMLRLQVAKVYGEDSESVIWGGRTGLFVAGGAHA